MIKKNELVVIGHRNPDTDAICSAVGYAHYLSAVEGKQAVAARCGGVNKRVSWVLEQAGVEAPRLYRHVYTTAEHLCREEVVSASQEETFLDVYNRMASQGFRSIPVLNDEGVVVGMPSLQELLELLLPDPDSPDRVREVMTSIENVVKVLGAKILVEGKSCEGEEKLLMMVAASSAAVFEERMAEMEAGALVVLVGDRFKIQEVAVGGGVRILVLTGGFEPTPELIEEAKQSGVWVISSSRDTASTAQLIRCSRNISSAVNEDYVSFSPQDRLSKIEEAVKKSSQPLFPVVDPREGKLRGVFSKSDLVDPPRVNLVLVDHNEFSQAVAGVEDAEVVEVLDHHRLSGDLVSREPLRFLNDPVGSTSTIVARLFKQSGKEPSKEAATCLLAGIISDTLHLTSPTTTDTDRELLAWLGEVAGRDVASFAKDFFSIGSPLSEGDMRRAILGDRKEYEERDYRISVAQIEEVGWNAYEGCKKKLQQTLKEWFQSEGSDLDFACVMVTDIITHETRLVCVGEDEILSAIDHEALEVGVFRLPGVVSRKKQMFPYLAQRLLEISA